jgi:hypothetical protein
MHQKGDRKDCSINASLNEWTIYPRQTWHLICRCARRAGQMASTTSTVRTRLGGMYWRSSRSCAVLDAATEEVLCSEMVYVTRIAVPLLETCKRCFRQVGAWCKRRQQGHWDQA